MVYNEICRRLQPNSLINFWRTKAGAEVDFVISSGNEIIAIEVKFRNFKKEEISTGMRSFIETYKPKKAIIVTKDFVGSTNLNSTKLVFIPAAYV